MKRCIICGNTGDDSSTVCSVCGNPYVDMSDSFGEDFEENLQEENQSADQKEDPAAGEAASEKAEQARETSEKAEEEPPEALEKRTEEPPADSEKAAEPKENRPAQEKKAYGTAPGQQEAQRAGRPARAHRSSAGPQIYGQGEAGPYSQGRTRQAAGRPAGGAHSGAGKAPARQPQGVKKSGGAAAEGAARRRPVQGQGRPAQNQGRPAAGRAAGTERTAARRPAGTENIQPRRPAQGGSASQQQPGGARTSVQRNMPQGNRQPYPRQPQPAPGMYTQGRAQGYGNYRIRETARAALHSPMFCIMALLYTAFLIGSIAAIFMQELNYSQYARIVSAINVPAQFVSYVDDLFEVVAMLDTDAVVLNLVLKIPDVLFCLGLWLIFFMSGTKKQEMSGAGFLLGKIAVIVRTIMACVAMVACLIISVAFLVASWVSGSQVTVVVSAVLLVLMIVVTMMVIMYYASYLGTIKVCRLNATTGESYGNVSGYLAVMSILLALFSVINLLSAIVNVEISGLVSSVGNIGWLALLAVWIFRYRGDMSEYEE